MFDLYRDIFKGKFDFIFSQLSLDITNEGWQKFATPKTVCDMMIDKYEYKQNDKILVLFNAELIMSLYYKHEEEFIEKHFYFIADTVKKNNYIKKYLPNINCKYLEEKDWSVDKIIQTIKEFNMPKHFDVVFTNPPYTDSLDLKLLNSLIEEDIVDKIIAVHPTSFIFSKKLRNYINKIDKLESAHLFWGNEIFNIKLFVPVCISVWNMNKETNIITIEDTAISNEKYTIKSLDECSFYGTHYPTKLVNFIKKYKTEHEGSIIDAPHNIEADYSGMNGYLIKFAAVRGNRPKPNTFKINDDFFTMITQDYKIDNFCEKDFRFDKCCSYGLTLWSFNTKEERMNFVNYCKTKVVRFLLSLKKFNQNMVRGQQCEYIPWMDFTKKWTDEKLIKEFNIDKETWDYIDKFIPEYYSDYKTVRGNI